MAQTDSRRFGFISLVLVLIVSLVLFVDTSCVCVTQTPASGGFEKAIGSSAAKVSDSSTTGLLVGWLPACPNVMYLPHVRT